MSDTRDSQPDRRKRPRHETPVEVLRRIRDALDRLRGEADGAGLAMTAEAVDRALAVVEADIRGRLV